MRITNNMLVNNMINYIGNNLTRMNRYQQQLATGKKVMVPSDDPVVAARALKLRTDVSEIEQYQRNIKDADSWTDITESAMADMVNILHRAKELSVQGTNGPNQQQDMQNISKEIQQLRAQMVHLGNATYAGRYIFSGYSTDKPLLNDDGTFAVNVNTYTDPSTTPPAYREDINYEIGIGDSININVMGGDLFNSGGTARVADSAGIAVGGTLTTPAALSGDSLNILVDGTYNITINFGGDYPSATYPDQTAFLAGINGQLGGRATASISNGMLKFTSATTGNSSSVKINTASSAAADLKMTLPTQINGASHKGTMIQMFDDFVTALDAGDYSAVGSITARIDKELSNVLRVRADVGARQNRIELTQNRLNNDDLNFTKLMSDNEDVDMAETIMNLQNEENVYRASLSGGARIIQPSLVDFLR